MPEPYVFELASRHRSGAPLRDTHGSSMYSISRASKDKNYMSLPLLCVVRDLLASFECTVGLERLNVLITESSVMRTAHDGYNHAVSTHTESRMY